MPSAQPRQRGGSRPEEFRAGLGFGAAGEGLRRRMRRLQFGCRNECVSAPAEGGVAEGGPG